MRTLVLIAAGGALGSVLRFLLAGWGQRLSQDVFPVGTLAVNVLGCLGLGYFAAALSGPVLLREEYRLALLVGLFGGFTTFSTFGYESFALLNEREWSRAALNVLLSNALGLLAVWIGYRVAQQVHGV